MRRYKSIRKQRAKTMRTALVVGQYVYDRVRDRVGRVEALDGGRAALAFDNGASVESVAHLEKVERFVFNGCGSSMTQYLVPDWLPAVGSMKEACFQHDLAYWAGGDELDRDSADETFRQMILAKQSERSWWISKWFIRRVANVRFWFVSNFGSKGSFEYTISGNPRQPYACSGEIFFRIGDLVCPA